MKFPIDIPPGLFTDDTTFAASGRWADCDNVRFRLGKPQMRGGWESLISTLLGGVCRTAFTWTDNDAILNIAFGTHETLELYQGGSLFDITPSGLAAGEIDGTGSTGYGTGGFGVGGFGSPSASDYFPRTWSLGAWGENLLASPRGGTLYEWTNNTANPATAIANAPDNITHMMVTPTRQVMALGCNEEVSGTFNPVCIRVSDTEDNTDWTTSASNLAEEIILPGGGRIVAGRFVGDYAYVWTNAGLFFGTYVGSTTQGWRFVRIGQNCGLIGPNAAAVFGQTMFWISPDRQFWTCQLGGVPTPIDCPIREDFADNLAASQGDKIVASTITEFGEVRWDYPDSRDGYENSRYVVLQVSGSDAGAWSKGVMARTAMVDAGPSAYPLGVTYAGNIYWHERGQSADGSAMSGYIETADMYLDPSVLMLVRGVWADIQEQVGACSITLTGRYKPQGDERTIGPYAMAVSEDKTDLRLKARLIKVKFSANSAPAFFRLGKPVFDAVPAGKR